MINLRYHIVSLVAVFLALAVGVIAGTTVISENLVKDLERQQRELNRNKDLLTAERDGLREELDLWERYGRSLEQASIAGALTGRSVALIAKADVPGELIAQLEDVIESAGARLTGRLSLTPKWKLEDETARAQLSLALGQPETTEIERLVGDAAARLAARLRTEADPTLDADLISQLQRAGFIATHEIAPGAFPTRETLLVLVSPGRTGSLPPDRTFMVPLAKGLSASMRVAVAEPLDSPDSLAEIVRGDGDLREVIATVDHADTIPGRISLVAVLRALGLGLDAQHYGRGGRASGVAPSPSPRP